MASAGSPRHLRNTASRRFLPNVSSPRWVSSMPSVASMKVSPGSNWMFDTRGTVAVATTPNGMPVAGRTLTSPRRETMNGRTAACGISSTAATKRPYPLPNPNSHNAWYRKPGHLTESASGALAANRDLPQTGPDLALKTLDSPNSEVYALNRPGCNGMVAAVVLSEQSGHGRHFTHRRNSGELPPNRL